MLKQIEEFNPFNYHGYFFIETDKDIVINFFTSNSYTIFNEYDVYRFNDCSLIAIYDVQENIWIKDFQVNYEGKSIIYQNEFYEKFKDILNGNNQMDKQVYLFMNSQEIKASQSFENVAISTEDRCDFNKFGPASFYPKISNTSAKITDIKLPMSITGIGHIFRGEVESWDNAYSDKSVDRQKYTNSRTFSGCLKLIYEWSLMTEEPWNNTEEIAIKAREFLKVLNLSQQDFEETLNAQCDMRIAKYLKREHEHSPLPENHFISDGLKTYFSRHYKYLSLKGIKDNHPMAANLAQAILNLENSIYQEMISYYCILNGIDESTTTLKEIHEHVGSKPHYLEEYAFEDYNGLITDVIEKMLGDQLNEH